VSRSVDLFVGSDLPIDQLAAQLGSVVDAPFTPSPTGATFVLRDGSVVAELARHAFADDGDLLLSRYRYTLSSRVPAGARPQDTPEAAVLRRVAQRVRERGLFPVLLVMDLQYREGAVPADAPSPADATAPAPGPGPAAAPGPGAAPGSAAPAPADVSGPAPAAR
jgi:hypothetical protein